MISLAGHRFDLSRRDLGAGFHFSSVPLSGEFISIAVFRSRFPRRREGALFPARSYDLYINLTTHTYTFGGPARFHDAAREEFFHKLLSGDSRVVASYVLGVRGSRVAVSVPLGMPVSTVFPPAHCYYAHVFPPHGHVPRMVIPFDYPICVTEVGAGGRLRAGQ